MTFMTEPQKIILVIGGTGAQGLAVVKGLLKPAEDGSPSPYKVRVMTRDPASTRAKQLVQDGVEVVQGESIGHLRPMLVELGMPHSGTTDDFTSVMAALEGAYGAFVNTDSFTIGEAKEIYTGMRIFELAKQSGWVKHYVWSSLDYGFKVAHYHAAIRL